MGAGVSAFGIAEGRMRRILVVDDEPLVCDVIADCFEEWPETKVVCVFNGAVAADALRAERYDLVLVDAMVPGVSASMAAAEDTPVVLMSGHPQAREQLAAYGWPHVCKPFSLDRLFAESQRAILAARDNISCVKACAARMQAGRPAEAGLPARL
jgi:DNA-binding response OmpR family regulator